MATECDIFQEFSRTVPDGDSVIDEAFNKLPSSSRGKGYIKSNFSILVDQIEEDAHKIYRKHERKAGALVLSNRFTHGATLMPRPSGLEKSLEKSFDELNSFFLSLSQSRKARAGKAFELIIKKLFKALEYPFDEQVVINGKPDFLLPGKAHYGVHATDCIIFTAKRTLRERWRQIVTEGTKGLGFYLATIDEKVSVNNLAEMNSNRIYLVMPAELKTQFAHYRTAPNVIAFETFFKQHLDPAMTRWRENKVI